MVCLQEVVSTSNSNTVVSLCRLFEMLLAEPVKQDPGDQNIRTWIMVLPSGYCDLIYSKLLFWNCNICMSMSTFQLFFTCFCTFHFSEIIFLCATSLLFLYDCRQLLPSPWCGLWVAAVMQTAERSLMSFSGWLCQESQKNILSLPAWGNGSVQWMREAWCMTIFMRYCVILIIPQRSFILV